LQTALSAVPRERRDDPQAVAEHFIKGGKLTRFQAEKLLKGTASGLLLGPYQVLAPIGKGGMGAVFLARDSRDQLLYALKVLPPKKARSSERMLARFRREMDLSRRVAHPHLARTHEVGVSGDVNYIAMEFIPGQNLYRLVLKNGPLAVPRAARLFAEVAAALDHAHAQGLIHRDLKPSNVMVTPNDHAKVLDLGLALSQGEDTRTARRDVVGGQGYVVGSMDYIAPEQTEDASRVDPRADVYGLGCTLYYALTGQPPFPGGTSREKILNHRSATALPITALNPAVPPEFAALAHRMMAKQPEARFPSAAAVRAALLPWAGAGGALPLDQDNDASYQRAVAALAADRPPSDLLNNLEILEKAAPAGQGVVLFGGEGNFGKVVIGLVSFWAVVLLGLILYLMLR
jgi:serine/threonine protein kinase